MLMGHTLGNQKSSLRESSNLRESLTLRESSNLRIRSNNTRIYRAGILSAFVLFLLTINLLFPISVDTNSAEGAALPSTTELAINTDYSSANLDFTTISSTGTFASSSAEDIAKFTVTTNNYTGYTLTLAGNDDTGQLNNISAGAALDSIATSGIESSSFSTNEWGYLPSKYNSEANTTKYYSAPTTSDADTLDVTNAANASNTPNEYTISLGAKVDYSKPAGTYTNTFILAAVGNPVNYTINYLDGTNDPTVQNLPTAQSSTTGSSSVVLNPNKTPTRTGYTFSKWCMGTVNTTAPSATDHTTGTVCTGTEYANGDSASFVDQTVSSSTLNLYALWTPNKYNITIKTAEGIDEVSLNNSTCTSSTDGCVVSNLSYNNDYALTATPASGYILDGWSTPTYGTIAALTSASTTYTVGLGSDTIIPSASMPEYMQDWSKVNTLNIGDETTLIDARDGKYYKVAKLADGQVWMTTSLNLAGGTKLYSETSDVPAGYPESGGTGYFTLPTSSTSGFDDNTTAYVYNAPNKNNPDPSNPATCTPTNSTPCDSYYSWMAATAGGKDSSGNAVTGNGPDTAYSVCPKGWRLPKSGKDNDTSATSTVGYKKGDFYKLATAYGANLESDHYDNSPTAANFYNNAGSGTLPNFLLAGYYYSGSFYYGGSNGWYWSSSSNSSTWAYSLYLQSSYVDSAFGGTRKQGSPVRCVLRDYLAELEAGTLSMQEFGALDASIKAKVIDSMDTTKSYALKDTRDGKYYNIAKLADGRVWMTTSLNLAGGTTLNASDSDVPTDNYFTLPSSSTSGFSSDTTAYAYNAPNKNNPDPSNPTTCTPSGSTPCDSYYSWLTATAGGKDANGSVVTDNGYNAAYSVCPKGWRLPTATTSNADPQSSSNWKTGDNYKLATAYGANLESQYYEYAATFYNNAGPGTLPNFLLAGYYNGGFSFGGSRGYYWSSSSGSSTGAYNLYFTSSYVYSANSNYRRYGFPVRCILKEGASNINEIETMQELGKTDYQTEVLASMDSSTAYTLKDERDDKYYKVAKLADGQVWMTTSLNLAGGTTLNASDSDVPTNNYFTLPSSSTSGFSSDTTAYVYNAPNKNNPDPSNPTTCTPANGSPCDSYYSWLTATAGGKDANGNAVIYVGHNATYSVCPKGWRLPTATTSNASPMTSPNWKTGDNYKLATAYGANLESSYSESAATFYNNAGPGTLPNFLLAGYYYSSSFRGGGSYGRYWSSSSSSSTNAFYLNFDSSAVNSAASYNRRSGYPVRCILRES